MPSLRHEQDVIQGQFLSRKKEFLPSSGHVDPLLLYGCIKWTLTKRNKKRLDGNCTRMQRAIPEKSWKQHPTRQQLYGHLIPISKTIQIRQTRHAGHCWRSKDELISNVLRWTLSHRRVHVRRPTRTYQQQLCTDTGCSLEDLPKAMDDRNEWREIAKEFCASSI